MLLSPPSDLIINAIRVAGLAQGLLMGLLFLRYAGGNRSRLWLGLFLVALSLPLFPWLLREFTELYVRFPRLLFLPIGFYMAVTPLFYLYVRSLAGPLRFARYRIHLLPVLVEFVVLSFIVLMPGYWFTDFYGGPAGRTFGLLFTLSVSALSITYAIAILRFIARRRKEASEGGFRDSGSKPGWVYQTTLLYLLINVIDLYTTYLTVNETQQAYARLINVVLSVGFIYWVGLSGLWQQRGGGAHPLERTPSPADGPDSQAPVAGTADDGKLSADDPVKPGREEAHFDRINRFIAASGHTHRDLNQHVVAERVGMSYHDVSRLINAHAGVNFNTFVNQYRIEAAKQYLTSDQAEKLSYEGIATTVGFRSKSTFYRSFKEMTGQTPGAYRRAQVTQS
jgi:AraC-like DNA-binding protein